MFTHKLKQINKTLLSHPLSHLLSQRGIGLAGVMIAAALIVVAALVVSNFLSDQYHQSEKLQISGDCQNIANSLVEYLKKDETSLFITSYGPSSTGTYSSNLDKTTDGVDRFNFFPTAIHQFSGPGTSMNLGLGKQKLSTTGWKSYNNLNIKNSTNRLIALAGSGNYCCDDLDMNNAACGARFYDDTTPIPGFKISEKDVEVDLAIDFKESACSGQKLAPADLPDSSPATTADFKVRVTMKRGTPQEKICEGTGTVQRTLDQDDSLSILQFSPTTLCAGAITPAICDINADVTLDVRTFKKGNGCEASCLQQITSVPSCSALPSPNPDLFNAFTTAQCAACLESEPGTAFLCRIGEKSWMNNPANRNKWEPCETATVKDFNGASAGNVTITYNPLILGNDKTQRTTAARITLSNLTKTRGYVADVRAVDTAGNVGPSFCENSPSCDAAQPVQFSAAVSIPWTVGPWSACISGSRSRTVTCSGPCCTGAAPPSSEICSNGACGSANGTTVAVAPSVGLCSAGTATAVTGSGPWNWSCNGSSGGTNATCSANLVACTPWTVGPWSACSSGTQSRTVSCSSGTCCSPTPLSTQACSTGDCTTPWGATITNGASATAYQSASAVCPAACVSQTRNCNNGTLSGSYSYQSCAPCVVVVNGAGGVACNASATVKPTSGLCSSGTATTVTGTGPWSWKCLGSGGGADVNCTTTGGFGMMPCCESYAAPGWRDPVFVGTSIQCTWMKDNLYPGYTCMGASFQSPPPPLCSAAYVLVDTSGPLNMMMKPLNCVPYSGPTSGCMTCASRCAGHGGGGQSGGGCLCNDGMAYGCL